MEEVYQALINQTGLAHSQSHILDRHGGASSCSSGKQTRVPLGLGQGGNENARKRKKEINAQNKVREDRSGIACRGNFMSGLKWAGRRGRLSNADWSSSHLFFVETSVLEAL